MHIVVQMLGGFRIILVIVLAMFASGPAADYVFDPATTTHAPNTAHLLDITRAGERVVVVGERGLVIYSDDQAKSWQQASVPVSATLTAVSFVDDKQGWAVGHAGVILHTSDGGASWQLQLDGNAANRQYLDSTREHEVQLQRELAELEAKSPDDPKLEDLEIAIEDAGYAIEDAEAAIDKGPADPFLDVLFLDANTGFAVGSYGMFYQTVDGGANWKFAGQNIDNVDRFHYYSIAGDKAGYLYLSGEAGLLFRSADRGNSWERIEDIYDGTLFGVVPTSRAVVAFGLRGHIFRSEDQGETWQEVISSNTFSLYGGAQLAEDTIALVGAGGAVLLSDDGGATFSLTTQPDRSTLSSVASINNQFLAVGMSGVEPVKQSETAQ